MEQQWGDLHVETSQLVWVAYVYSANWQLQPPNLAFSSPIFSSSRALITNKPVVECT